MQYLWIFVSSLITIWQLPNSKREQPLVTLLPFRKNSRSHDQTLSVTNSHRDPSLHKTILFPGPRPECECYIMLKSKLCPPLLFHQPLWQPLPSTRPLLIVSFWKLLCILHCFPSHQDPPATSSSKLVNFNYWSSLRGHPAYAALLYWSTESGFYLPLQVDGKRLQGKAHDFSSLIAWRVEGFGVDLLDFKSQLWPY